MATSEFPASNTTPYSFNDRDFGRFSDHITVWVDAHIGEENTYDGLKNKFDANIQVLRSNNPAENEIDDDTMLCADKAMLGKLKEDVYCLKYFATMEKALRFILQSQDKKIFFISSGSIGEHIVPHIAELPQLYGVYIFCGHISSHTKWAHDYVDCIKAMLEHQDDLLERLTRDLAEYLEQKGDRHKMNESMVAARNCYSWSKKLLIRGKSLGDTGSRKLMERVDKKLNEVQSFSTAPSQP